MAHPVIPSFHPFFSLPIDLRLIIYSLSLFPTSTSIPEKVNLYDAHCGFLDIHVDPTLLRASRQIYTEASSLLHQKIIYHIDLTKTELSKCAKISERRRVKGPSPWLPASLFRDDAGNGAQTTIPAWDRSGISYKIYDLEESNMKFLIRNSSKADIATYIARRMAIIHAHVLRRMEKLKIETNESAIWAPPDQWGDLSFTDTGEVLHKTLKNLAVVDDKGQSSAGEENETRMLVFMIVLRPNDSPLISSLDHESAAGLKDGGGEYHNTEELISLTKEVRSAREVEIAEIRGNQ